MKAETAPPSPKWQHYHQEKMTMRKTVLSSLILGFLLLSHASMEAPEDEEVAAFEGTGDRYNEPFSVAGPWRLQWQVEAVGSFPSFEVRLTDASSGRPLGVIVQTARAGEGRRTFESAGRYHLDILARDVRWQVRILQIPQVILTFPDADQPS